ERRIAIGPINGRLHVLIYVKTAKAVRVISLRKANAREVRKYNECS
ncbi:MAG: BrnT family toxin, partial [Alphaproteobacteria bacterium]